MKVLVSGGTGFVGDALVARLVSEGYQVTVLSRRSPAPGSLLPKVRALVADPNQPGPWQGEVAGFDAVINLAGASIFKRWDDGYKKLLRASRLNTTRHLVEGLDPTRPVTFISASAVGYYGPRGGEALNEDSPPGDDFLARLCRDWEEAAMQAGENGHRVAITRFGIVLGKGGGALKQMLLPFRFGLGGRLGSGEQWFSWIHRNDLVEGLLFILGRPDLAGPFNFTAPKPLTNRQLTRALAGHLKRPAVLPVPAFALRFIMGEFAQALLTGQKVLPERLEAAGFSHEFPTVESTLADLI